MNLRPLILLLLPLLVACGGQRASQGKPMKHEVNRLIHESSPYLQQHAHNPVDWWPWGDEAFAEAKRLDKPVFLSIGYSTCHWCHVMERESFEVDSVAAAMNRTFVCIKLDREERPDIDHVYMQVCQMLTGSGGWPLTVFLTPERQPFFAGTYFPAAARGGRVGVMDLCAQVSDLWNDDRQRLLASADEITAQLGKAGGREPAERLLEGLPALGAQSLMARYDQQQHGFGTRPKFPSPHTYLLLLRSAWDERAQAPHDAEAAARIEAVTQSLLAMGRGGIHDHVGGGFHRYSTDREWHLPHFEKMLYDQAMMLWALAECLQLERVLAAKDGTRDVSRLQELEDRMRGTVECMERDFRDEAGGYCSAEDADAAGVEGSFQVWSWSELSELLAAEELELAARVWGLDPRGNWRDEASGHDETTNILHQQASWPELSRVAGLPERDLKLKMEGLRQRLFDVREKRTRPGLDDKVLTDWNGLYIAGLARAAAVTGEATWHSMAERAADFLLREMKLDDGRLLHRWHRGEKGIPAMLDDHAFLVRGLLELAAGGKAERWLPVALELQRTQDSLFWNPEQGVYHMSASDSDTPLVRPVEDYDGAIPSGNSISLLNLVQLARLAGRVEWEEQAGRLARGLAARADLASGGHSMSLVAIQDLEQGRELTLRADHAAELAGFRVQLSGMYLPGLAVLSWTGPDDPHLPALPAGKAGGVQATVCEHGACLMPADDSAVLKTQLLGR